MLDRTLLKYLVLWLAMLAVAFLVLPHCPIPNVSVPFWMAAYSLPLLDGGVTPVEPWEAMPLSDVWYFLVLSIAGAITLVKILSVVAQSAIAHRWKRATAWVLGLLGVCVLAYALSLLAFRPGPWQNIGLIVLYATRGSLGPTVIFAAAIIFARFLSRGPRTEAAKNRLFLALSGLSILCGLTPYVVHIFLPTPDPGVRTVDTLTISLILLCAAMYVLLALLVLFSLAILIFGALRRKHG